MLRVALVGYGVGGRLFHAPYLEAARGVELVAVVARSADRQAEVRRDLPELAIVDSIAALASVGVDAVVISTPPATRQELVLQAVAMGYHVVADKPFAPTMEAGAVLARAAEAAGVLLNVYQNRRWDGDILTARDVLASGELGRLLRLDLRCDQNAPGAVERGPGGGLLRDLGSHLIDQALHLLGPVTHVMAHLDTIPHVAGATDVSFVVDLVHVGGAHSHLSATKLAGLESRELRLVGERGAYTSDFSDVQYEAVLAGRRPAQDRASWGAERPTRWGAVHGSAPHPVRARRGDYARFYEEFAHAVAHGGPGPVPPSEGLRVLQVLDAARASAESSSVIPVRRLGS